VVADIKEMKTQLITQNKELSIKETRAERITRVKRQMQLTANKIDEFVRESKLPSESEFKCPELIYEENPYVNQEWCESFCFGKGCKFINTCPAYNKKKREIPT